MSQERRRSPKLAQARRRHTTHDAEDESDENDNGAPLIDDSASEAPSEDELQLSASDKEDEGGEEPEDGKSKVREHSKDSVSPPTSESYDRLEDDTLQGVDFVDLAASNGSVGPAKVTDTAIMLNGFKDISTEEKDVEEDTAMHFDELDDSISFEPRPSDKKPVSTPSNRVTPSTSTRGGARDRPDRETYWQRRNREKEEYKKRLEDPTFTPFVGDFFMHDSREKRQFDSLNQFGVPRGRGRGRGGRGFRGGPQREMPVRDDPPQEALWDHAGFEELEPQPPPQPKVYFVVALSHKKGKAKSQTSSVGRQTPQHTGPTGVAASQHAPRKDSVSTQDTTQPPSRPAKNHYNNLTALTSTQISINISLPNTEIVVKDITLKSYVGRIPYQKPLRGDRPVKISSIEGAGNREIFPSKERSWLPYFLKNAAAHAAQVRDGLHSRGGSVASTGTPSNLRPTRNVNGTPIKVPYSAVHAPSFNPSSPAEDEDEKTTKIKVNLPPTMNTASSASPAVSDSSSLHVHHPRPTKHINIADIDDSSARLKAFLNPQTSSSPAHSHERTSSTQIPETAVHAAPFQPTNFLPTQQPHQQQIPVPFPPNVPYYYPAYPALPSEYPPPPPTTTQNPYIPQQPRYESNGMVYYYDPAAYYYYQAPPTGTPTQQQTQPPPPPPPHQHHQQNQPSEQPDPPPGGQQAQQQMYYYHPSQMPVTDPSRSMGMYFPYQQGT